MVEALSSSETSVLTGTTWRNIPEDAFFIVTAVKTSNLNTGTTLAVTLRRNTTILEY
jgi:hypothetical protein